MPELTLGTAQFGLSYGISNNTGKPSEEEVHKILNTANDGGINLLDTAYAYGNSERLIGDYLDKNEFKICTKSPSRNLRNNKSVKEIFKTSLSRLKMNTVDYYLLHDIGDLNNRMVIHELKELKKQDLIKKLGVSIYNIEDAKKMLEKDCFDAVQLPLNIFDRRMIKSGTLKKIEDYNIDILIRSIFLQGLFFLKPRELPSNLSLAQEPLSKIRDFTEIHNIKLINLIFSWFKSNNYGDYIIIGVENKDQLVENINLFNDKISQDILDEFERLVKNIKIPDDSIIIDPRRW